MDGSKVTLENFLGCEAAYHSSAGGKRSVPAVGDT